jgi:hypothetical protein
MGTRKRLAAASFVSAVTAGVFGAPLAAEAQQTGTVWRIGYLD